MGLDATVYRNLDSLPLHLRERVVRYPGSGELDWRDFADDKILDSANLQACHERIGNIAAVAFIEEEIATLFGNRESWLSTRVVYSGSHTGDFIPFSEIDQLEQEVNQLEALSTASRGPELSDFIAQMRNLVAAAKRERNAIVF
jgi:hypothetical protein